MLIAMRASKSQIVNGVVSAMLYRYNMVYFKRQKHIIGMNPTNIHNENMLALLLNDVPFQIFLASFDK